MNRQITAARFAHRIAQQGIEARPLPVFVAAPVVAKASPARILAAVALAVTLLMPMAAIAKGHRGGGHASHAKRSKKG